MRQFLLGLSLSLAFMIGCAVGTLKGTQSATAEPTTGKWFCFHAAHGAEGNFGKYAEQRAKHLDLYASEVSAGQILATEDILCVKK
ncbi:MAG: hypothetical protein JW751_27270 [Polyangiaceae bacterium]|nr:hypothetical protein [Polyangiaceae bacterium]